MIKDAQGNPLTGATTTAADLYDKGRRAFNLYSEDPFPNMEQAVIEAPEFVMGHLLQAYMYATATEPEATRVAQRILKTARKLPMSEREASHVFALEQLIAGNWHAAAEQLDFHNAHYPHDLVGIQCGHLMDFYRTNSRNLRDRIARVLPHWSAEIPGYSLLLGMYAFGLEECGEYDRAEEYGRRALDLEPFDCWAHHAVTHVLEMQGRAQEGIEWMKNREPFWADKENFFKVHNWWHRALFHLDLEEIDEATRLYDNAVRAETSSMALDLVDASALLWRLWMLGVDVASRSEEVADCWLPLADGHSYPFNDWHAVMAYLVAGHTERVNVLHKKLREQGNATNDVMRWASQTGLPLVEGFIAFARGNYAEAMQQLHGARYIFQQFGGSHAQRDIIDWTLAEAAIRSGERALAEAFANERLAQKPESPMQMATLMRATQLSS
ncbi:tetratricopeptide repeat protein [Microbulbifer elongatus]|uniref:tetratricopeptide repeat protein n=1 Tax=Microbulbifer elongatus TaxID=86173 RepID=UPI001CFE8921|nr:tetratricopeptide repeat protein [Microbulbifer elongatus]